MSDHACHLLWLTWSGRLVYLYDGSRSCHLHSSKFLWRMHQNYATLHAGILQQRYPMAYWQLLKPATEQMHYSSSPSLHPSEEQRENIKFYGKIRTQETVQVARQRKFWCHFRRSCPRQVLNHATLGTAVATRVPWSKFHREKPSDVHVPASATVWVMTCKKATGECLAEATLIVTYFDSSW